MNNPPIYLNISRLRKYGSCRMDYWLSYVTQVLGGPGGIINHDKQSSAAMQFGTSIHAGLEAYVREWGNIEAAIAAFEETHEEAVDKAEEAGRNRVAARLRYGTGGGPRPCGKCNGTGKSPVQKKPCMSKTGCNATGMITPAGTEGLVYGREMIKDYVARFPVNEVDEQSLYVEKALTLPLDLFVNSRQVVLIGRLDRVIKKEGGIWHRNYKTMHANVNLGAEMQKFKYDPHEAVYWNMLDLHFPDEKVIGSYIDGLMKTRPATFHRLPIIRNPATEEAAMAWVVEQAEGAAHLLVEQADERDVRAVMHKGAMINPLSCISPFGGGMVCSHADNCTMQDVLGPQYLSSIGWQPREEDYGDTGVIE